MFALLIATYLACSVNIDTADAREQGGSKLLLSLCVKTIVCIAIVCITLQIERHVSTFEQASWEEEQF